MGADPQPPGAAEPPLPGWIDAGAAPGGDERRRAALRPDVAGAAAGLPRAGVSARVAVHRNGDAVFGDASITGRAVRRCAAGRQLAARLVRMAATGATVAP